MHNFWVHLAYALEKGQLLKQRLTREVNLACFESGYLCLISICLILQSSLLSCLYFLTVIYYYGILSGTVSSITDTSMTSPKCGRAATHNLPKGVGLSFFCHPSLKGRYVTIRDVRPGESGFNLCEVEVYSEQRGMAYLDIFKNYYWLLPYWVGVAICILRKICYLISVCRYGVTSVLIKY